MYPTFRRTLLLISCLTNVRCLTPPNVNHSVYTAYSRLREDILFRPASRHQIPPCLDSDYQERYELRLSNLFVNIGDFDEIKQVMTVQLYIGITWPHPELTWDPADYDNISTISIHSSEIWTPLLEVNMGGHDYSKLDIGGDLRLSSDGKVNFMKLTFLPFTCSIDFKHYPFDTQTCSFGFYPHGPPYANPTFHLIDFNLSSIYSQTGEWELKSFQNYSIDFVEQPGLNLLVPTYRLVVKRSSTYYVICIVFPLVLTSAMIPLVFVIPSQTGEKVSYLVALFTSTAVFLNYISDVMPRCLPDIPYLAMLLVEVLGEGLLAMLATLLVVNVHAQEEPEKRKNKVKHAENAGKIVPHELETSKQSSATTKRRHSTHFSKCPTSKVLDRTFFVIFFIGQIMFLLMLFLGSNWLKYTPSLWV